MEGYNCVGYGNCLGGIVLFLFFFILMERVLLIEWDWELFLDIYFVLKGIEWNYLIENIKDFDIRIYFLGKKNYFKKWREDVLN